MAYFSNKINDDIWSSTPWTNVAYVIHQVKLFHLLLRSRHKSGGSCCYDDDGADEKKKIESVCSDSAE